MGLQKMLALKQEFLLWQLRCWQQSCQKNLLEQQRSKNKRQTNKWIQGQCFKSRTVLLIPNLPVIALPMTRSRFLLLSLHCFITARTKLFERYRITAEPTNIKRKEGATDP